MDERHDAKPSKDGHLKRNAVADNSLLIVLVFLHLHRESLVLPTHQLNLCLVLSKNEHKANHIVDCADARPQILHSVALLSLSHRSPAAIDIPVDVQWLCPSPLFEAAFDSARPALLMPNERHHVAMKSSIRSLFLEQASVLGLLPHERRL